MSVDLGLPQLPPAPLAPRRKSRQIMVGKGKHAVPVGGGAPVSVQSMTTTVTADVNATLQQIAELTAAGCQIVRVAVPSQDDADALPEIARKSQIPVIADIHFQPKYVFAAIDAGCGAVRVNPGNIKAFDDKVGRHRPRGWRRRGADQDRRQRRLAGQAAAGQVRQGHP
jgi:(E)-4-hydroxy-3-methylbut-2-enyl-diphosphate synthase